MFAVIKTGGKQYKVAPGDVIQVEKLDAELGEITLNDVLMIGKDGDFTVGKPFIEGAAVKAMVLPQGKEGLTYGKGEKIYVLKRRRRKNYRRKTGHRQLFTELKITSIEG